MDRAVSATRIALIGAGPAGLAFLRSFAIAEAAGEKIPEIICFDKQSDWGGQWNMTWRTGLDEHGEPVHSGMYPHMWTNVPKESHEYADYSYDEHFGRPVPSYLEREQFRQYFLARAEKSGVKRFIRFNQVVRYVDYDSKKNLFTVRTQDLVTGKETLDPFDYVVVATGHYSIPNVAHVEGIQQFPGKIIHSHDFRNAEEFAGQDILIIGNHFSGEDVALQTHKFGAKSVTLSYRNRKMGFNWPDSIKEVPLWARIQGKTVTFKNGAEEDFDSIIICTGYCHYFPFIAENLRLMTNNRPYPADLYKGIFFQHNPNLLYLSMQDFAFTTLFDGQGWYARDVILGRIKLPDVDERKMDINKWLSKESNVGNLSEFVQFQMDYILDLLSNTNFPPIDMNGLANIFKAWAMDKNEDIITFRNKTYRSIFTGTMAEANPIPWILCDRTDAGIQSVK